MLQFGLCVCVIWGETKGFERANHSQATPCRKSFVQSFCDYCDGNLLVSRLIGMKGARWAAMTNKGMFEMNKTYIITGVLVASMGIAASSAFAFGPRQNGHGGGHGGGDRMDINFEELDTDSDGQITKAELQAMGAARFDAADTNGDGALSAEELQARAQQQVGKRIASMIERFDKNGDGLLSRDEMPQGGRGGEKGRAGKMFEHFDEDGSGGISQQEFDQAKAQIGERRKGRWGGHGHKD